VNDNFFAMKIAIVAALICLGTSADAQDKSVPDSTTPGIQDNSFLVEEAYNQEAGVVQHITTFERQRGSNDFAASFTQEWPVGSIRHQLSYDLPLIRSGSKTGLGDIGINYRYQLIGSGETRLAVSPRVSALLPTGDWKRSMGSGGPGVEGAIPVSFVLDPALTLHSNVGITFVPRSRSAAGDRANTTAFFAGQSAILTLSNRIQPMVEAVYARGQEVIAKDRTDNFSEAVISPGVRGAFNFASGLQIVPGIAFPIGVGPSNGERGVFLYLSFEHPFTR
jgi:hypothetical protein